MLRRSDCMKILYIAHERCAAQVASRALSRIAPNLQLSWASSPGAAMGWIRDNPDAHAVIAEAGREDPAFDAFLEQVRSLGVTAPIAAIAPEHLEALSTALEANTAGLTAQHDAALARTTRICTALQEQLMELEAALHGADERYAAQTTTTELLTRREAELSAAVAEAAVVRAAVERRLAEAEAAQAVAHQRAVEELAAAGERYATAEDRLARETALRLAVEERLSGAEIAREQEHQTHAAEIASLTARVAERDAQHDGAVARINRICTTLQERLLELEAELHSANERHAADAATIQQLLGREMELGAAVADAIAARTTLAHALADKEAACQRGAADLTLARQRCSAFEEQVAKAATARSILEQQLEAADRARHAAAAQHATELTSLTTHLVDIEAQYAAAASQIAVLDRQLHESGAALEDVRREWRAEVVAATERLRQRETELGAMLADALAGRASVEATLAEAESRYRQVQQRSAASLAEAVGETAAVEARLRQEISTRTGFEERLAAAESARHDANRQHALELASMADRAAELQAHYESVVRQRVGIEEDLAAAAARLDETRSAWQSEVSAAEGRHAAFEGRLEDVRREWQSEVVALTERLQQRETELGAMLADALAGRAAVETRLAAAESLHQQAQQRSAASLAEAVGETAAVEARLREQISTRTGLEERLAAAEFAHHDASRRHALELASMADRAAQLQADYEAVVRQRAAIEEDLAAAAARLDETRSAWQSDVSAAEGRHAALEGRLEDVRREWQSEVVALTERLQQRETELGAMLADALAGRAAVETRLAAAESLHQQAQQRSAASLAEAVGETAAVEARLREQSSTRTGLEERLAAAEFAHHDASRRHALELASMADRAAQLQADYEAVVRQRAAIEVDLAAAAARLDETRSAWQSDVSAAAGRYSALDGQLEVSGRDNRRLSQEAEGLRRQLDVMRTRADSLRRQAAQVPTLQEQLEGSLKENRRQFERAPYGLAECNRDGSIIRVNHTFARVLGYRSGAELQDIDLAEAVFESGADLRWLLGRVLQTGAAESLETTLRTRDQRRLSVRLHAHSQEGSVAIAVEDLTALRDVEQRLREAHRLEAVGRVASEVAATCDTMLRDVSQGGQQWLAALDEDTRLRQQGELLLGDVTRAAGFLRQFVVYGHQQISNVASVNLARALRDMSPVLKRVLGDEIVLLLPRTMSRFEIDVDAARVERILVNVANYARQRMPHGGRVKVRLATAVVDRQFVASHPKVRPGAHALITIEEIQGPVWPALPVQLPSGHAPHPDVARSTSDRPGMDLGPLVALIGEVGGHLWMSAEPAGNMTLQIHLPKRAEDESLEPVAAFSGRARQLARWFRH